MDDGFKQVDKINNDVGRSHFNLKIRKAYNDTIECILTICNLIIVKLKDPDTNRLLK